MGVLNLTPDSFSDGGECQSPESALERGLKLIEEGADILDLGAESTRPGALPVSGEEELSRLVPVLEKLRQRTDIPISIDTTKPQVARACLEKGADIINDVSGLRPFRAVGPEGLRDSGEAMAQAVRDFSAGLVLMHRRGTPQTMHSFARYQDTAGEVASELEESLQFAERLGLRAEQIVLDPGLGFAKNAAQNFEILENIEKFHALGRPLVLGPSRKSFIGEVTGRTVGDREFGTAAVVAFGVMKGIQIFRVHEAGPMRDVIRMTEALRGERYVGTF